MPERWELEITVPPITETVYKLLVRCGHTTVVVEPWVGKWVATSGSPVTKPRPDYDVAVADARRWVEEQERRRLLANAAAEAVTAECTLDASDPDALKVNVCTSVDERGGDPAEGGEAGA